MATRRFSTVHAITQRDHRFFDWSGIPSTHIRPTFITDWLVYVLSVSVEFGDRPRPR